MCVCVFALRLIAANHAKRLKLCSSEIFIARSLVLYLHFCTVGQNECVEDCRFFFLSSNSCHSILHKMKIRNACATTVINNLFNRKLYLSWFARFSFLTMLAYLYLVQNVYAHNLKSLLLFCTFVYCQKRKKKLSNKR